MIVIVVITCLKLHIERSDRCGGGNGNESMGTMIIIIIIIMR